MGISSTGAASPTLGREGAATPRYVSSTAGGGFTLSLSTCQHVCWFSAIPDVMEVETIFYWECLSHLTDMCS